MLRPSVHPSLRSSSRNAAIEDCPSGSFSADDVWIPIRRSRPVCCAWAVTVHATVAPLSSRVNSRRLIKLPPPEFLLPQCYHTAGDARSSIQQQRHPRIAFLHGAAIGRTRRDAGEVFYDVRAAAEIVGLEIAHRGQ